MTSRCPTRPRRTGKIVDSRGDVFLLQRLMVKDINGKMVGGKPAERLNRTIVVPSYVPDIAKVQIWCAFAETLLGETTFDSVVMLDSATMGEPQPPTAAMGDPSMSDTHMSSKFQGVKVNTGFATHTRKNGKSILTLSDD
jgi:hypothetical protein